MGKKLENHKEFMDVQIRTERRKYFDANPNNTSLAIMFNNLLAINGTYESDMGKHSSRELRAKAISNLSDTAPVPDSKNG